jgi:putative (di)nucleoside polyphosphate hydrolase
MSNDWIDEEGYRANVGIILADDAGKLLLGGRVSNKGWQFPQGGVSRGEDLRAAMYRELREEIGLEKEDVEVLGVKQDWIRYRLPDKYVRRNSTPVCIGQKLRWFMLRLIGPDDKLRFDLGEQAEFDRVRWVDYWRPVNEVIYFKRRVYAQALHELGLTAYPYEMPPRPRWWPKRWHAAFEKDLAPARKV